MVADSEPLSLKEISRSVIRIQLRKRVEFDHPMIVLKSGPKRNANSRKNRNAESNRVRRAGRRCNRRVIIPIFEESDDTNSNTSQRHANGEHSNDSLSSRVVAAAASSISAVFQQVVNSQESDSSDSQQRSENYDREGKDKLCNDNPIEDTHMDLTNNDNEEREMSATIERTKRSISITGIEFL